VTYTGATNPDDDLPGGRRRLRNVLDLSRPANADEPDCLHNASLPGVLWPGYTGAHFSALTRNVQRFASLR
jgi:hypothetical protein